MDLLEQFRTTHECPKCANSYFSMHIRWMDTYVKTVYTCEDCNWSVIVMSSCTSPASAQAPSSPNQSAVSEPQTQLK
jgi:ribosomal protein L37AE/L43A